MTPGSLVYACGGTLFCIAALGTASEGHLWASLLGGLVVAIGWAFRRALFGKKGIRQ